MRSSLAWMIVVGALGCDGDSGAGALGSGGAGGAAPLPLGFECVGAVEWPPASAAMVSLGAQFQDFATGDAHVGLSIAACLLEDGDCASPVGSGITGTDGSVSVTVPTGPYGFVGFLEATGAVGTPPLLAVFSPPIAADQSPGQNARGVIAQETLDEIAAAAGVALDAQRGHIIGKVRDCSFVLTRAGITVRVDTADASTETIYFAGKSPSAGAVATDEVALFAVLNVVGGPANVTATIADRGVDIGKVPVVVRAAAVTTVSVTPTP